VITVTYNPGDSIIKTIQSIVSFKTDDVEFILIDGGSDQKSISLLEPFLQFYDVFITEKDKGIYDAMNKAWDIAKGKYIIFINDGDMLIDLPLEILRISIFPVLSFPVKLSSGSVFKPEIGFPIHFKNTLHHQGTFYLRELKERFDTRYKVFADFDLNIRLFLSKKDIKVFPFFAPVSYHSIEGVSNSKNSLVEFYDLISDKFGWFFVALAFLNFKRLGFINIFKRE